MNALFVVSIFLWSLCPVALAGTLPVRLPLHLKSGMFIADVEHIMGGKPVESHIMPYDDEPELSAGWSLQGQITYKQFQPSKIFVIFKRTKLAAKRSQEIFNREMVRFKNSKSESEQSAILDAETKEANKPDPADAKDRVERATLSQEITGCDDLRSAFADAFEFINQTYAATPGKAFREEIPFAAQNCLDGPSDLTWAGENGYKIELSASGDGKGKFDLYIMYSKNPERLQKEYQKTKLNL